MEIWRNKFKEEPLGWESDDEYEIETEVFHACGRKDVPEDVQDLIRILWWQYCIHANTDAEGVDNRKAALNWVL